MKKIQLFALFIALGVASACKSEEANPEQTVTSILAPPADLLLANATLSGASEVPAVTTTAKGTASGNYKKWRKRLECQQRRSKQRTSFWKKRK